MNMKIIPCMIDDLHKLREISIETFDSTFKEQNTPENMAIYMEQAFALEKLKEELLNRDSQFYFVYYKNELAGYLKINWDESQSEAMGELALEVERIYLKKEFQKLGIGRFLLDKAREVALEKEKGKLWLGVWEYNASALLFYEKVGFVQTGSHPFYMGDEKQTDFIMEKHLV